MARSRISEYGATFYLKVTSGDSRIGTAYFGTPPQAITAQYGLQQTVPDLVGEITVHAQTPGGFTLTLVQLGTGFYWIDDGDPVREYGVDPDFWPIDDDGERLQLYDTAVGINPERVPLVLLSFGGQRYRCWTPEQAITTANLLRGILPEDFFRVELQTDNGLKLWWLFEAVGPVFPYQWYDGCSAYRAGDDHWPMDIDGDRLALQQLYSSDDSIKAVKKPEKGASAKLVQQAVQASDSVVATDKPAESDFVLQPWVAKIPMMQQTVLMTALRGPDSTPKYGPAKYLLRWYRRCILLSAMDGRVLIDPVEPNGGSFTGPSCTFEEAKAAVERQLPKDLSQSSIVAHVKFVGEDTPYWASRMNELVGDYLQNLDATPYHYHNHFMHGAQILGAHHPDLRIRKWWKDVYVRLVHEQHLEPESDEAMNKRLGDNRADWLARADVALSD